jgi:hypothetical protein
VDLFTRAAGGEPDFIVRDITGTPSGVSVILGNTGGGGIITEVNCVTFGPVPNTLGRVVTQSTRINMSIGGSATVRFSFAPPATRVTCWPSGVDLMGNPEAVTANNVFTRRF